MFANMVTSLFEKERIITTKQKGRELKKISEKIITRAKNNIDLPEDAADKKLHNKRIVMKTIKDRDVVKKLFDEIAPRFKGRNGGYTRLYLLGRRPGDAAEMAIVELVERKSTAKKINEDKGKPKDKKKDKPEDKKK